MNSNQENLIFQFLLELEEKDADVSEEEKKIMEKLHDTKEKYKISREIITEIKEHLIILKSEIKYRYFKYGITAEKILETANLN